MSAMSQREAVRRAWDAAERAEQLEAQRLFSRAIAAARVSQAWSDVASQLPFEAGAQAADTAFIPRVVEPIAEPLCHCAVTAGHGHPRAATCR